MRVEKRSRCRWGLGEEGWGGKVGEKNVQMEGWMIEAKGWNLGAGGGKGMRDEGWRWRAEGGDGLWMQKDGNWGLEERRERV